MLYILSLLFVQFASIGLSIKCLKGASIFNGKASLSYPVQIKVLESLFLLVPAIFITAPFLIEVNTSIKFKSGESIAMDQPNWAIPMLILGSLMAIAVFGTRLYFQYRRNQHSFSKIGVNTIYLFIGFYMLYAAYDHMSFFSDDEAGMVNWSFFQEYKDVPDIVCHSDILIVKGMKGDTVQYRCPLLGSVIMGRLTSKPFIPWPGYAEGNSKDLALALGDLKLEAEHLE